MTLLAKSDGETLYNHSILTYEYGMKIIDMLPYAIEEKDYLRELASFPLLFHDIGKGALGFQESIKNNSSWKGNRHEILSAVFIKQFRLIDEQIFSVITHHKDILSSNTRNPLPEEQVDQYSGDTEVLIYMKKDFEKNAEEIEKICKQLLKYINRKISYRIELDDGIGINEIWINGSYDSKYGQMRNIKTESKLLAAKLRGIIKASDHLASSHSCPINQICLKDFKITNYSLRHFQDKCKRTDKDIILIAPTGSGKTEAALLWAQTNQMKNSRLFYVLPYQASINAMHKRLGEIFEVKNIGILHSNSISYLYNIQSEDNESKQERQRSASNASALAKEIYYPIRVCTPHQLLRFGLKGRGWEYLYLELSNGLLIYDEVHAYQPRIVGLTLATAVLLKKMGAKVAFTSATFPEFLIDLIKERINDVEIITPSNEFESDRCIMEKKRHVVNVVKGNLIDNLSLIFEEIRKEKKILIITNHVKTAQGIFDNLKEYNPVLLHSRFNKKDRREKESVLLSKNKPRIVISTQVIEVSLDIDYEVMFTEPAPIDALAQRFGRINRKGLRKPENIFVLTEQVSAHNLYDKNRVKDTLEYLKAAINPISESDLLNITNNVYRDGYSEEEMHEFKLGYNNEEILEFEKSFIAGISREWVTDVIDSSDNSCEVLPIRDLEKYESLKENGLWIEAKDLLISVNYNLVRENICEQKEIIVVNCCYDSIKGLLIEEKPSNFDL